MNNSYKSAAECHSPSLLLYCNNASVMLFTARMIAAWLIILIDYLARMYFAY